MEEYISKQTLYAAVAKLEELARDRYLDTPWDSPARARYLAQLNERTRIKQMVADAKPCKVREDVHGEWSDRYKSGIKVEKGAVATCCDMWNDRRSDFCPNCGADMRRDE